MIIELFAIMIGVIIFIVSYFFYDSKSGRQSVYISSYAGLIDFFAFLSGFIIFTVCLILYDNDWPLFIVVPLFISGCLQGLMHISKFLVRNKLPKTKFNK